MSSQVLVVSTKDPQVHAAVALGHNELPPLADSSVRVRPHLLCLGKNNLFYVRNGQIFGWWGVWPVPPTAPEPYNNADDWCTAKGWGFAEVVDSNIPDLSKGSFLSGWWPISTGRYDLKLESFGAPHHYRETSEHRQKLMSLYNHYYTISAEDAQSPVKAALFVTWGTGHLLNRFSFPVDPERVAPIFPLGKGSWTKEDADLTSTVVIGTSVSSKSGRSFSWHLANRSANKPLAYLQVTSSAPSETSATKAPFQTRSTDYQHLTDKAILEWISDFKPARVLLVDFGARGDVVPRLLQHLSAEVAESTKLTLIAVGTPPPITNDPELPGKMAKGQVLERIQCNHSAMQDSAYDVVGVASVFDEWYSAFDRWIADGGAKDIQVVEGKGVSGKDGVVGAWEKLSNSEIKFSPNEAWAYWM